MENIFLQILNMSLTAAVTVVVVLFIRLFLKKLPKKYSYLLWSVVGFRLLCPVAFNSAFSIFNLKIFERLSVTGGSSNIAGKLTQFKATVDTVSDMTVADAVGTVGTAAGTVSGISDTVVSGTANVTNVNIATPDVTAANMAGNSGLAPAVGINWIKVLMIVWLVGMIIMLAYGIAAYIAMAKKVRNAIWSEKNVYHSDRITSPFVFGLVRPRIYMPSFIESGASEYVMLHESYHIRRHDYIVKPIAFVLLCIHWFNPFVWAAFYFMGRDMEMSCDEAVIGKMVIQQAGVEDGMSESEVVKRYSYALLNCASHGRFNALFQLGFGEMSVKGRIRNVLKYKKFGWIVTAVMICVCSVVLAACGTNSKIDAQEVENPITPDKMMQISDMLDRTESGKEWTEQKLEIARALYKDFVPCGANIDGVWVKSLYNEEYDLLITQETADTYGIYHGEEHISVPVELPFPTENNVEIKLVDVNEDGVAELYISAYQVGGGRDQLIGLEPLRTLVDSYSNDGSDLKVRDYVKEYKLTDTWIGEDDKVHVSTEFVMNDGQTYTLEFVVEGADKEKTGDFVMEPVFFETVISAVYPYAAKQDIRFRVNQGSRADGNGYIFISVPMQYDDASGYYTEQGDIELYYREINPADWG